ncbi:transposase [Flavobacterium anhuiense]|uniref:transposase n=1 Tax=Flavobacterium anhuiense TaxID=459526 RepID=UPI003D954533
MESIIEIIEKKYRLKKRNMAKEITLDMTGSMGLITKKCFHNAVHATNRFHVQKLASESQQEIRIKYHW